MVIMASGIARGRVRTTATELPNIAAILQIIGWQTCSLGLPSNSLILDIHVMINWHLSKQGIRWPVARDHIAGSSLQLFEVTCFWSWRLTKCWLSIGSRAHIRLTCWKQGRIARKPVNANSGLKVNQIITFSSMFFAVLFCVQKAKQHTENLTAKLQNSNQNSTFFWVSLIGLWTTRPRSYAFRLA